MTGRHHDVLAASALVLFWSSGFVGAELGTGFTGADTCWPGAT